MVKKLVLALVLLLVLSGCGTIPGSEIVKKSAIIKTEKMYWVSYRLSPENAVVIEFDMTGKMNKRYVDVAKHIANDGVVLINVGGKMIEETDIPQEVRLQIEKAMGDLKVPRFKDD